MNERERITVDNTKISPKFNPIIHNQKKLSETGTSLIKHRNTSEATRSNYLLQCRYRGWGTGSVPTRKCSLHPPLLFLHSVQRCLECESASCSCLIFSSLVCHFLSKTLFRKRVRCFLCPIQESKKLTLMLSKHFLLNTVNITIK